MRIVSFIEEQAVINKILSHLGIHEEHAHSPPAEETQTVELTSEPYYDDLPINEILKSQYRWNVSILRSFEMKLLFSEIF